MTLCVTPRRIPLSQEMVDAIIDCIADSFHYEYQFMVNGRPGIKILKNCSLISRAWVYRSQVHIHEYLNISLNYSYRVAKLPELYTTEVAQFVKGLTIYEVLSPPVVRYYSVYELPSQLAWDLVERLPNLYTLDICEVTMGPYMPESLPRFMPAVRTLQLRKAFVEGLHSLLFLLHTFPNLEALEMAEFCWREYDDYMAFEEMQQEESDDESDDDNDDGINAYQSEEGQDWDDDIASMEDSEATAIEPDDDSDPDEPPPPARGSGQFTYQYDHCWRNINRITIEKYTRWNNPYSFYLLAHHLVEHAEDHQWIHLQCPLQGTFLPDALSTLGPVLQKLTICTSSYKDEAFPGDDTGLSRANNLTHLHFEDIGRPMEMDDSEAALNEAEKSHITLLSQLASPPLRYIEFEWNPASWSSVCRFDPLAIDGILSGRHAVLDLEEIVLSLPSYGKERGLPIMPEDGEDQFCPDHDWIKCFFPLTTRKGILRIIYPCE